MTARSSSTRFLACSSSKCSTLLRYHFAARRAVFPAETVLYTGHSRRAAVVCTCIFLSIPHPWMVCKALNTNRIFEVLSRFEIDISVVCALICNHFQKILNVYSLCFISIMRFILSILLRWLSVILCAAFFAQVTGKKNPPPRRGSLCHPGKGYS